MKHSIFIFALFFFAFAHAHAQKSTIELVQIWGADIDTLFCGGDTITRAYYKKEIEIIDWGAGLKKDTITRSQLLRNGVCPADSMEVIRQMVDVRQVEIQNRAWNAMNKAFELVRTGHAEFLSNRIVINQFTGSDMLMNLEEMFFNSFQGRYAIIDVENNVRQTAKLIRIGATNRYRLQVEEGNPDAGQMYIVIPLSRKSFQINNWPSATRPAATYRLYLNENIDARNPVFLTSQYITGGDLIRIAKIQ